MVIETFYNNPEITERDSTSSTEYSLEEYNNHYDRMMEMLILSAGRKRIEEQKLKLKLIGDEFEFTADNVQRTIGEYLWKLKSDENMKQNIVDKINNTNDRLDYPWIYQAAALILADLEKWSPYSSFPWKENSGLWVKALLGKTHYEHFMKEKKNCIEELNTISNEQEKSLLQDKLASCELDYIVNNILWANNKLKFFGSCEWKDGNPSKQILSEHFANELSKYKPIKSYTEYLK